MKARAPGAPQQPASAGVPRARVAVLHADDFGMSESINRGIVRGFLHGLLTSTSVLANAPASSAALSGFSAVELRRRQGDLPSRERRRGLADPNRPFDLGVHLNLTQGRPLTGQRYPAVLLDGEGRFPGAAGLLQRLWRHGWKQRRAIGAELRAQIAFVLDHGARPTHLNGHQYLELFPTMGEHFMDLLEQFGIPLMRIPWETGLTRTALLSHRQPGAWIVAQIKRLFAARLWFAARRRHVARCAFHGTASAGKVDLPTLRGFLKMHDAGLVEVGLHPGEPAPRDVESTGPERPPPEWYDPLHALRSAELAVCQSAELAECLDALGYRLGRLAEIAGSNLSARAA